MYIIAIAWAYVVMMMAVAEATAPNGTVLGALMTAVLYGVLPLSIVIYLMRTPARKAARIKAEAAQNPQIETAAQHNAPQDTLQPNTPQPDAPTTPELGAPPATPTTSTSPP